MHLLNMMSEDGVLLTLDQMRKKSNLGASTIRKLAEESGAVRKIGKSYRINQEVFFNHIDKEYRNNKRCER